MYARPARTCGVGARGLGPGPDGERGDCLAVHLARTRQDLDAQQEREHELMHLKDGAAHVGVQGVRDLVIEEDDAEQVGNLAG